MYSLVRVSGAVSLEHELADVAATLVRQGGGAPLFENVAGSSWPVFSSGIANQKRAAIALGCDKEDIVDYMEHVLEPANGVAPAPVEKAACQANV